MTKRVTRSTQWFVRLLTTAVMTAGTAAGAQQPESAQALLRSAIDREVVDGDLSGAIKAYHAIADRFGKTERATAVEALMHLADAYQRLGSDQAGRIYADVVENYADQKDAVAVARARLLTLRTPDVVRGSGPVCTSCVGPYFHSFTMSPDGRWIGFTASNNDLMSRNVQTGAVKRLVSFPSESYALMRFRARRATWSPDSRRVAYFFRDNEADGPVKDRGQLRVLSIDRAESRTLVDNPDFIYVFPAAWSPDGRSILVSLQRRDETWQLAWVSAQTGAITVLRSLNWDFDEFRNGPQLSPDGGHIVYATSMPAGAPLGQHGPARTLHILSADAARQTTIPAAASGFTSPVWSSDGSQVLFVSDRDNTGRYDLWAVDVKDGTPSGPPQLVKGSMGSDVALVGMSPSGLLYYVHPESSGPRIAVAELDVKGSVSASGPTTGFAGSAVAWSPEGKRVAFRRAGLVVRSVDTGEERLFAVPGWMWGAPAWTPDGSAVFVAVRTAQSGRGLTLARIDLESGAVRTVGTYAPPGDLEWDGQIAFAADGTMFVPATASASHERSLIAVNVASASMRPVLSGVAATLRLQQVARGTVGQAVEVASQPVAATGIAVRGDGNAFAVTVMKDTQAYLTVYGTTGGSPREWYGPIPGRAWKNAFVSRLGDPKWLQNGAVTFGIQQDDLSWTLMRVSDGHQAERLGGRSSSGFTLAPGTLSFDVSPDGRRVAYERLMTFSDELWALDVRPLLKHPR